MILHPTSSPPLTTDQRQHLIVELQSHGLRMSADGAGVPSRRAGAGPSDHQAITVMGTTVMVPVHTAPAATSPYSAEPIAGTRRARLRRGGEDLVTIAFPRRPRFYALTTAEGVPYWKIAQLHARDVLATTVLQHCVRYPDVRKRCRFCAIGESLRAGRTIATKTPAQLAEVAEAARRLDGVRHMVMTTGTPPTPDRGARVLAACAEAVVARVALPIQAQCEPPEDFRWFARLREAGVVALGMHLEAIDPRVRARVMPSKAEVPVATYLRAFEAAVPVFGRGQVSTYLIVGLGDAAEDIVRMSARLIDMGVYPFVVPFVPIGGTPMADHAPPSAERMAAILGPVGEMLRAAGMTSDRVKAGCARCGACSALSKFEGSCHGSA